MNRREFYSKVNDIVTTTREDMTDIAYRMTKVQEKIRSGRYATQTVAKELQPELDNLKKQHEARYSFGVSSVRELANTYIAELRQEDELNPGKLTDDAALLSVGVILSPHDVEVMFDRHAGNSTMQRLISDYAQQKSVKIDRVYTPTNADLIASVDTVTEITGKVMKWHDDPQMLADFMGEGSAIYQVFAED